MPDGVGSRSMLMGHIQIYRVYQDGQRELAYSGRNHIVTSALTALSELVTQKSGVDPAERAVHSLWVPSPPVALADVTAADSGPTGTVVKRAVFDRAADVDTNVGAVQGLTEYRAVLSQAEGNGTIVRAIGLYMRGDNDDPLLASSTPLFARQLTGAVPKDNTFALDFRWRIQFTIA